jgi:murein L,D-transpeptidase YcbB/YkuD
VTATNTAEFLLKLQNEATEIGRDHGWTHSAVVDAYGGDPHAEPDVPPRFAPVAAFYTTAYAEGVTAYFDDTADD